MLIINLFIFLPVIFLEAKYSNYIYKGKFYDTPNKFGCIGTPSS